MNLTPVGDTIDIDDGDGDGDGVVANPEARQLALFDTWATRFVATIAAQHRQTIGTYLRWGVRRRLDQAATTGTLRPWSTRGARQHVRVAVEFLDWLDTHHVTLDSCAQADIDRWFAAGTTTRRHAKNFLVWAIRNKHCDRRLRIPDFKPAAPTPMPASDRHALITRLFNDDQISLEDRVGGLLVVLYAQPASRITRLRVDDVNIRGDRTELDIGGNPIELIAPLDQLVATLAQRPRQSPWLFTGHKRQPLNPKTLTERLVRLGVTRAARVAALHELIREVPSPVLGPLIGYNPNFIADRAATLSAPFAAYPHLRRRT